MVLHERTFCNIGLFCHLVCGLRLFLRTYDRTIMAIIEVLEWPEIGFQPKAECEHCLERGGDIAGCWECEYKGYRSLTEEEELEYDERR